MMKKEIVKKGKTNLQNIKTDHKEVVEDFRATLEEFDEIGLDAKYFVINKGNALCTIVEEQIKKIERLEEKIENMRKLDYEDMLLHRDIQTPCERCMGYGVKSYGNTSAWHHGIGGQMITSGICDLCWGSGDANNKWIDLRTISKKSSELLKTRNERLEALLRVAICPNCDGSGSIPHQVSSEQYVTRDMAIDAEDLTLEGRLYSEDEWEAEQCQWCYEKDQILKENEKDIK